LIESQEGNFQDFSKLLQIFPKIFFAVLSIFNGLRGAPSPAVGSSSKLPPGVIDFSLVKQPGEYNAGILKKQKNRPRSVSVKLRSRRVGVHADVATQLRRRGRRRSEVASAKLSRAACIPSGSH